ncbi:GGDEF domain-containing protein [Phytohabitans rumicis]|uniref:GGDEF domain-containing protein n=1 Tax=Phytohabitans rumicis TaxID=1076125 RepID=A0A6V8LS78_9ACTN|nr:GGDEF domain-containing protein [Phytohabitans rumicis]GFJ95605.1 hypothetical protein Prum_092470 [Phytohabitans rumicis]
MDQPGREPAAHRLVERRVARPGWNSHACHRLGIDITARRLAETQLSEARERFQQAFDNATIGMCLTGVDKRFMQVNPALCKMLGYTESELLGMSAVEVTHPDDRAETLGAFRSMLAGEISIFHGEKRYLRANGQAVRVLVSSSAVRGRDGAPLYFVTQIEDVTARRAAEEKLVHQALHDSLTALPNRVLLMQQLREALTVDHQTAGRSALLFVDLDGFKLINDSLGHDVGDQVLRVTGRRLERGVHPDDTVARVGGDEFVILCRNLPSAQHAVDIAERLLPILGAPVEVAGAEAVVTASVGIAIAAGSPTDPEELIRDADAAMYYAKSRGRTATRSSTTRCELGRSNGSPSRRGYVAPYAKADSDWTTSPSSIWAPVAWSVWNRCCAWRIRIAVCFHQRCSWRWRRRPV